MRIGYLTGEYPRATDTFIQREVTGLRKNGVEVETFSVRNVNAEHIVGPEQQAEKNATFYILPISLWYLFWVNIKYLITVPSKYCATFLLSIKTSQPGIKGRLYQLFYFLESVVLAAEINRKNVTHLHNHFGDSSGTVTMFAAKLAGITFSMTLHGPHIFFEPEKWALREKIKQASFVACISYFCKSQSMICSDYQDWGKFKIIRCGVDTSKYTYKEVGDGIRKILYTGRLSVEKGLPILFESLVSVKNKGFDFELTLAGDGPDRKQLEDLAFNMGLSNQVKFVGYASQDSVRNYLNESELFVLPSFAEGVPVSLMEAMATGIPVISTYVGGIVELIDNGRSGFLVSPSNSIALAEVIERFLNGTVSINELTHNARKKIESNHCLDKETSKLASLFKLQNIH